MCAGGAAGGKHCDSAMRRHRTGRCVSPRGACDMVGGHAARFHGRGRRGEERPGGCACHAAPAPASGAADYG